MSELLLILGCVWALILTIGRMLLADELKGWLSNRHDQAVEGAIASLSADERAQFEEDWRATYARYKDRPFSAWRCTREFTISARNLAEARGAVEKSGDPGEVATGAKRGVEGRWHRPAGAIRKLIVLARVWSDIDLDALGAPLPRDTLKNLVPGLRVLPSMLACSAAMSGVGMFAALDYLMGSGPLVAAMASIAFAAVVWNLDRWMSMSLLWRSGAVIAAPRILLTAVMSLAIAQPLMLAFFSREINSLVMTHAGHRPSLLQAIQALDTLATKHPSVLVMRWALTVLVVAIDMAPILACLHTGGQLRRLRRSAIGPSLIPRG
jgi:hypothetical protein